MDIRFSLKLFICACALHVPAAFAAELLIENVTVLSPERAQPLRNHHVLIQDQRIARVSSQPIVAKGAQRIDGRGKFLTPGLMDSHVHVTSTPGLIDSDSDPASVELRDAYFRQQPRSYLYFGVTQLLDPSNGPDGIALFEAQPQRPDLFRCGAAPALNGYPSLFIEQSIRYQILPTYIFEPANAAQHPLPAGEDPAAHTPEAVVERIAKSGARCVKVFIEDGFGNQTGWPVLSRETLKRVRTLAHQRGLLFIAHANALGMQRIAVEVQADVIAHGLWNWDQHNSAKGMPEPLAAHLRKIHGGRIGFQPTLRVLYGTADLFRVDTLKDPMYAKVVPKALLAWYGTEAAQWYKRQVKSDFNDAPDMSIMQRHFQTAEQGMRALKYLHEFGHPLLLASDTPSSPTYGNQPGYDTYREMRLMAQAGIPLATIFQAATINNARQFKLERDYGTIEAGKIANLLLLDANPLETIRAWSLIDKIVLRGKAIERETLQAAKLR